MRLIASMSTAVLIGLAGAPSTSAEHAIAQSAASPVAPPQVVPAESRAFINRMAIAGMAEVQLGKLATERAASPDVKAFGERMVKDHSQANNELAQVAAKMHVQLPQQLDQAHRDLFEKLSRLQGAEFDREYMAAMVHGHEEVLKQLRARVGNRLTSGERPLPRGAGPVGTAGRTGQGEEALTAWAMKMMPAVEQHLQRAREIDQKVK